MSKHILLAWKLQNSPEQFMTGGFYYYKRRYNVHEQFKDFVQFLGRQSDVYKFLTQADVFTLPSLYEGVPLSIIEAMGTGLPIVATNVGGIPDMIDNSCAILTSLDINEIANAFEKYYLDKDLREKHGLLVKERALEFSSTQMAEKYVEIYRN